MKVLVDTPVWSLALRRGTPTDHAVVRELAELVREGLVVMVGAVRQEILSGIRQRAHFERLRDRLRAFDDLVLDSADYEGAAECFNLCRGKGIQGSNTDFLMCAVARARNLSLFTTDRDFERFGRVLDLELHRVRDQLG
jgi:predicted nucleic acid-binding protein